MKAVRQRGTSAEVKLGAELKALGCRFRTAVKVQGLPRRTIDIAFPDHRVAVLVDGCFWHGCSIHGTIPKANRAFWESKITLNIRRDRDTTRKLIALGWKVIRVWSHDAPKRAAVRVSKLVRERPQGSAH